MSSDELDSEGEAKVRRWQRGLFFAGWTLLWVCCGVDVAVQALLNPGRFDPITLPLLLAGTAICALLGAVLLRDL
jgi:hypothetical protein